MAFDPIEKWEIISNEYTQPNKHLYQWWKTLSINSRDCIFDQTPGCEGKLPIKLLSLVDKSGLSPAARTSIFEGNTTLVKFNNERQSVERGYEAGMINVRYLTDEELEVKNLGLDCYKRCLKQISEFWAQLFNKIVPQSIQNIYADLPDIDDGPDIDEVTSDDLSTHTRRFPVIFFIDHNFNMTPDKMKTLKKGINQLVWEISNDPALTAIARISLISCCGDRQSKGNPIVWRPFCSIETNNVQFFNLDYNPFGACRMAAAINLGIDQLTEYLGELSNPDVASAWHRPWFVFLSDGHFITDGDLDWAVNRLNHKCEEIGLRVYVRSYTDQGPHFNNLFKISNDVHKLDDLNGFFSDVYQSLRLSTGSSDGGKEIKLENQSGFRED